MENTTVQYWVKNTWAYSIDKKPSGDVLLREIQVPISEIKTKKRTGKRYYRLIMGQGVWEDCLIPG